MSIPVPVAIAGVMVAAAGTGLLAGRCIRSPRPTFAAWAIAMLALTAALLAQRPAPAGAATAAAVPADPQPVTNPYGLIAIYTLPEDRVADFDRIAGQVAEQVRAVEPDTLVYVIHTVPKAPMQRIFYEVYSDRAAWERHERQPHVKRFVTGRRPYVLATNVIEVRLTYAKTSPFALPGAAGPAPAALAGSGARSGNQPAAPSRGAGRDQPQPSAPRGPGRIARHDGDVTA